MSDTVAIPEEKAAALAKQHRTTSAFICRLAVYAQARRNGLDAWDSAADAGLDKALSPRYERWYVLLADELIPDFTTTTSNDEKRGQ